MCAINGFTWRDEHLIEEMNAITRHRGPDDTGVYTDSEISLGHNRLSIIDLSKASSQPMLGNNDKTVLVYNGEFYNFKEIKEVLSTVKFKSNGDAEVILRLYETFSRPAFAQRYIEGMFAYAIYDKARRRTLLVRDRFGIKPLYYYYKDGKLIFSSEIKGILVHDIPRIPNKKIIYDFVNFSILDHSDDTFFEGIKSLRPGHMLIFNHVTGNINVVKWYNLRSAIIPVRGSFNNIATEVKERLINAVNSHLVSDVPVGSCLSGGIDSSSIVSIMSGTSGRKFKTFSLTFDGYTFDESKWIDIIVSNLRNIDSYKTTPDLTSLKFDMTDLIRTQEEPFGSLSIYGQYCVMRLAKEIGMKVLLDGQGSDEIFAGYFSYFKYKFVDDVLSLRFKEAYDAASRMKNEDIQVSLAEIISHLPLMRSTVMNIIFKTYKQTEISGIPMLSDSRPVLQWALLRDICEISVPQLLRYEDKNSMRWGIESRVPFLDRRLVEYSMGIQPSHKIIGCMTKCVLRRAMKGIIPEEIRMRRDKIGYQAPDEIWFMEPYLANMLMDANLHESMFYRGMWDVRKARIMFGEHLAEKANHSRQLWKYINLDKWYEVFIEGDEWRIQ